MKRASPPCTTHVYHDELTQVAKLHTCNVTFLDATIAPVQNSSFLTLSIAALSGRDFWILPCYSSMPRTEP